MKKLFLILICIFYTSLVSAQDYRIFAGRDHTVFIGKWASPYDLESIWNKYGEYGSKYKDKSIWNNYGDYGSKYKDSSPWNAYSSNPPVMVDKNDRVVGYLTCGYKADYKIRELMKYIVEHFDEVANDPTEFYNKKARYLIL